jgi:purine-binding chemotaxis protein CheW
MNQLTAALPSTSTVFRPEARHVTEALVFLLDGQEYGITLGCVQEIRSYQAPTRLAGATDYVLGVMDLRGEIVPILDMRLRLGLARTDITGFTVVIVVSLGSRRIGIVADQVNDVVALQPDEIRRMPGMGGHPDQRHFVAIASLAGRSVVLLDIEALLDDSPVDADLVLAS